jgi:OPT family oligopeptide transporter
LILGPVIVVLSHRLFDIPIWAGVIALPLAVIMGVVAARVTGETDVTPTKALGPVTQLIYGALLPGHLTANIMSANVTGGVGLHAADLLTDLKSGFLLGAKPRQQFYAQLFGCLAGAIIIVPAFNLLIPDAQMLGSEMWPAPSAQVWAGVSIVLSQGLDALHPSARNGAIIGFFVGIVLTILEKFAPRSLRPYVPAPSGLGIGFVMPAYNCIMMFLGSLIAEIARRKWGKKSDDFVVPVSSGFIAGESLMGILVALLAATGVLSK